MKKQKHPRLSVTHAHKLRPRHAKAVRVYHIGGLLVLLTIMLVCAAALIWLYARNYQLQQQALDSNAATLKARPTEQRVTIKSNLGFQAQFDATALAAQATHVAADGSVQVFEGADIMVPRDYSIIQLTATLASSGYASGSDYSRLTLLADKEATDFGALERQHGRLSKPELIAKKFAETSSSDFEITKTAQSVETINNQSFIKQIFLSTLKYGSERALKPQPVQTIVYSTLHNDRAFAAKISGVIPNETPIKLYEEVIQTVSFDPAAVKESTSSQSKAVTVPFLEGRADAASKVTPIDKRMQVIAAYTPAVVKIYHVICGDFIYRTNSIGNVCAAKTGSGFFVSSDGYIASNGHVVSSSAKEAAANSLSYNSELIAEMLRIDGYTKAETTSIIRSLQVNPDKQASLAAAIYQVADTDLYFKNPQDFYTIALGKDVPDVNHILNKRQAVAETDKIKSARLIDIDFNMNDLLTMSFTKSDVALLKIEGTNYPSVKIGSVNRLVQGEAMTVIGFPGAAENELTDNSELKATATSGVISAVRNTNDATRRVIQSDAKIGHGNSGGPAFDDRGQVFGIATYIYESGATGDSTIAYMRDIDDLRNLAVAKNISFRASSEVQSLWEDGLQDFFDAHYSTAISKFKQVIEKYPAHSLANEYITISLARIQNGEEAIPASSRLAISAAFFASLFGIAAVMTLMIRHHYRHQLYVAIAEGAVTPEQTHSRYEREKVNWATVVALKNRMVTHHKPKVIHPQPARGHH